MLDRQVVINHIQAAFSRNVYPGDEFLIGSSEGCEPIEEVGAFIGQVEWSQVPAELLDAQSAALHFFSEAGLRFYIPAYLIADLNHELHIADPLFTLCMGFSNLSVDHQIGTKVYVRKTGKDAFINPQRYGALTFYDYSRYRLSVFSCEEAGAIVNYLEFKREHDPGGLNQEQITAALNLFWYEQARSAPGYESIQEHLRTEEEYIAALLETGEK